MDWPIRFRYQPWSHFKGLTWAYTDAWEKHVYAHLFPPNTKPINTYHTNTFRCQEGDSGMCPTSNHPGGVNVVVHGRLGPFHQELGQLADLVVHGNAGPRRNRVFGQLLRPSEAARQAFTRAASRETTAACTSIET